MEPLNPVKVLLVVLLARQRVNAFSTVSELTAKRISWSFTYGSRSTESFNSDTDIGVTYGACKRTAENTKPAY